MVMVDVNNSSLQADVLQCIQVGFVLSEGWWPLCAELPEFLCHAVFQVTLG